MSVTVAKASLIDSLKQLRLRWDHMRGSWDDEASRRFEREFIAPLEGNIRAAIKGLEHVGDLMAAVRRDCGDDA